MGFRRLIGGIFFLVTSSLYAFPEDGTLGRGDRFVQLCRSRLGALSEPVVRFSNLLPKSTQKRLRTFSGYEEELSGSFSLSRQLTPDDLWIDWGVGSGFAFSDFVYYREGNGQDIPHFIGVDLEESLHPRFKEVQRVHSEKVGFLTQRAEECHPGCLPLASLATDLFGPLSYTAFFDLVLFNQLSHLRQGGVFVARIGKDTYFVDENNRPISIEKVLEQIKGVKVLGTNMRSQIALERIEGPLEVPAMEFLEFEPGLPPARVFKVLPTPSTEFTEEFRPAGSL